MNKALEVIEAHYLFAMPAEKIDVLIHQQSVVHSMVEYADGSILAQMGASDMRTPIASAMAWPERMATPGERLDFKALSRLDFLEPDTDRFPALARAFSCLKAGEGACIALNAANEIAVEAFLAEKIRFLAIIDVIDFVLESFTDRDITSIEAVIDLDEDCRRIARDYIQSNPLKQAI
jgi:1-deoxy-D-xylulose-5-phosphate reductoisomerase